MGVLHEHVFVLEVLRYFEGMVAGLSPQEVPERIAALEPDLRGHQLTASYCVHTHGCMVQMNQLTPRMTRREISLCRSFALSFCQSTGIVLACLTSRTPSGYAYESTS